MRQIEQELVSALKNLQFENGGNFCKQLEEEALGQFSPDFLNVLEEYQCSSKNDFRAFSVSFSFRVCIEHYLLEKDTELKKELFSKIANNLTKIKEELSEAHGQSLFPEESISLALIRNVYLSKDQELINLFKENLPKPRIQLFEEYAVSDEIKNEAEQTVNALQIFLQDRKLPLVEFASIKTQRQLREKKRQREEIARLADPRAEQPQFLELKGKAEQELRIKGALREANRPYIPKSPWKLLNKNIFVTASTIELFSTVHHLTSESGLVDIFNDALYGHRTLQKLSKRFKRAALFPPEAMLGGDANVICCGPFEIDPLAKQKDFVDIVFDLDKLKGNRCAFYKQLDFSYRNNKIRSIKIGNRTLYFSHTYRYRVRVGYVDLIIFEDNFPVAVSRLPNHTFISYNILQMHQILTLNFFRFLDNLKKLDRENLYMNGSPDEKRINSIYADINELNPTELSQFLIELGQNMSDTAEFNIYGAYKIDFAAIKSITIRDKTLDFVQFVTELQSGEIEKLNATIQDFPTLFKSYRLLNYLLSKVQEAGAGNTAIQEKLLELKQSCSVPLLFRKMDCQKVNIKTESSTKTLQRKPAPLACSHAFL